MGEARFVGIKMFLSLAVYMVFSHYVMAQQNVQFSQYMFNNMVINPAYAGAEEAISVTLLTRNQWSGIENAPSTQTLSAHTLINSDNLGLGFTIVNDRIGVHKNLSFVSNYAYHLPITESSWLSMGLQAGLNNRRSEYSSLNAATANDPKLYDVNISETFFEVGAGAYFRSPKWHIGISAPELIPDRVSIADTLSIQLSNTHFFLFSKYRLTHSENLETEPSVMIKYFPGLPLSFDVNINIIFRQILTTGLSYRKGESIDFLLKAQVTPQLEVGYAYDYSIGDVSKFSKGSHELMLHYHFRYLKTNVSSPRQ